MGSKEVKAKLVIVDSSPAVTGGLRGASRMARLLAPWVSSTLVLPSTSSLKNEDLGEFHEVVRMPIVMVRKSLPSLLAYLPALAIAGWKLRRLLRDAQADILVLNDFNLLQGAVVRLLGFRGRIVTWVRFDPLRFPGLLSRSWLKADLWASDAVVAVSDFIVERLPRSPKIHRIYDSVDLDLPTGPLPPPVGRDVVYLGNYIRGKGQDSAIEAFAAVAAEFSSARLIFHGGDMGLQKNSDYRRELEERAAAVAPDQILFREFATDLVATFQGALAALNLSESETFSLSCLEASQLGLPVIAFRSGGPEEIIADGESGFLCPLGDIAAVSRALRHLLANPGEARKMGVNAAALVQHRFGRGAYISGTRKLLGL